MVKPRDRGSDGHPEGMIEFASGRAERFPLFVPFSPQRSRIHGATACLLCLKSAQDKSERLYDQYRESHRCGGPKQDGPMVGHGLAPAVPDSRSRTPFSSLKADTLW